MSYRGNLGQAGGTRPQEVHSHYFSAEENMRNNITQITREGVGDLSRLVKQRTETTINTTQSQVITPKPKPDTDDGTVEWAVSPNPPTIPENNFEDAVSDNPPTVAEKPTLEIPEETVGTSVTHMKETWVAPTSISVNNGEALDAQGGKIVLNVPDDLVYSGKDIIWGTRVNSNGSITDDLGFLSIYNPDTKQLTLSSYGGIRRQ